MCPRADLKGLTGSVSSLPLTSAVPVPVPFPSPLPPTHTQIPLSSSNTAKVTIIEPVVPEDAKEESDCAFFLNKHNNLRCHLDVAPGKPSSLTVQLEIEYAKVDEEAVVAT